MQCVAFSGLPRILNVVLPNPTLLRLNVRGEHLWGNREGILNIVFFWEMVNLEGLRLLIEDWASTSYSKDEDIIERYGQGTHCWVDIRNLRRLKRLDLIEVKVSKKDLQETRAGALITDPVFEATFFRMDSLKQLTLSQRFMVIYCFTIGMLSLICHAFKIGNFAYFQPSERLCEE